MAGDRKQQRKAKQAQAQNKIEREEEDHRSRMMRIIQEGVIGSRWFDRLVMATILANTLLLWPWTDATKHEAVLPPWSIYNLLNYVFVTIFMVEFVLKVYVSPFGYWRVPWNLFDFFILWVTFVLIFIELLSTHSILTLRVIRTLRVICVFRLLNHIRGLQILMMAFFKTVTEWVAPAILLLLIILYIFAIISDHYFNRETVWWGSIGKCLLSLISFFTADGWTGIEEELEMAGFVSSARVFAVFAIILGNFIFTQTVVAIILLNIDSATAKFRKAEQEQKERILRHKKEYMMIRQRSELNQLMHSDSAEHKVNLVDMLQDFRSSLTHQDITISGDLSANIIWIETFMRTLEQMEANLHSMQQLHYEMANNLMKALELKLRKTYVAPPEPEEEPTEDDTEEQTGDTGDQSEQQTETDTENR